MTWQARAACRASPALFDLDLDAPETPDERDARHDAARAICKHCPVRLECLTDAMSDMRAEGIRGGAIFERHET